jgi:hypothetical protein
MDSPSQDRLAGLLNQARRATANAAHLVSRAKAACLQSAQAAGKGRVSREARAAWIAILADVPADPDHMVILCARCHHVKGKDEWIPLPSGIEGELKEWDGITLSHGYCPECFHELEAATHPA